MSNDPALIRYEARPHNAIAGSVAERHYVEASLLNALLAADKNDEFIVLKDRQSVQFSERTKCFCRLVFVEGVVPVKSATFFHLNGD